MRRRPNSTDASRSPFAPVAVLCGAAWALRGWIGTMDPNYVSPSAGIDYIAVVSYSVALIALAASIWQLRVTQSRWVRVGGAVATIGLLVAGIANAFEDGLGVRALGVVYVASILIGTAALLPLGVALGRETRTRGIALLPLLTVPGLVLVSQWYGCAVLATTWIVAGALHGVGRRPLSSDR